MQRLIKDRDFSQELTFTFLRSQGPGGQHVNKVNTQAEVIFSISQSNQLSDDEKELLLRRLSNRINSKGELLLRCQEHRSQLANKRCVLQKLLTLLEKASHVPKKRIPTKVSKAAREKRLKDKKRKSDIKAYRSKPLNP